MKVALYCRVSTQEQKDGKTIDSQVEELNQFAKHNDYEIFDSYNDDGWSGGILERPELDRLRDDAKSLRFDGIVVHHPDRLSRTQLHQLVLLDEFEKAGINIQFVDLPEYSEQSEESKVVNKGIWSMVSELERLRIRERTRRGRRYKAEIKGIVVGHIPPYGYRYVKLDKENKTEGYYEIKPEEARVVKLMFRWAKAGMSDRKIVARLAKLRIPRRNSPKDPNKPIWVWATSTVHKILTNETYTGVTYFNKYESVEPAKPSNDGEYKRTLKTSRKLRSRDKWIPIQLPSSLQIISKKDFNFVQEQRIRNRSYSKRNTKNKYLVRGLVRHKPCGSLCYANSAHGKPIYRCSNKARKFPLPKVCNGGSISTKILDPIVWNAVKDVIMQPNLILKQASSYEVNSRMNRKKDVGEDEILTNLDREEERLIDAYKQGAIDLDQLKKQMDGLKIRKRAIDSQKSKTVKPSISLIKKNVRLLCRQMRKTINSLSFEEKQNFMRLLLKEIKLGNRNIIIEGVLPAHDSVGARRQIIPTTSI